MFSKLIRVCAVFSLCAVGVVQTIVDPGDAQATPMAVTDINTFNNFVGPVPIITEDFGGENRHDFEIVFDSGLSSTFAGGNTTLVPRLNQSFQNTFFGKVSGLGIAGPLTLTWTFPRPVIGFIADVFGTLDVTIPGSDVLFRTPGVGLFGVVNTAAFSQIQFSAQGIGNRAETFTVRNLRFVGVSPGDPTDPTDPTTVPEPGTIVLLAFGLLGLILGRRRSGYCGF